MKRAPAIGFSILLAAMTLTAQTGQQSYGTASAQPIDQQQSSTNFVVNPPTTACPVSMQAKQGMGQPLLAVRNGQRKEVSGQHIHLILAKGKSAQVARAMVKVYGLSAKGRITRAL